MNNGDDGDGLEGQSNCEDHPLNLNPQSNWAGYFKDNESLMQIDMDCRRLYPGFVFFQNATNYPCRTADGGKTVDTSLRKRVEQVRRILGQKTGLAKFSLRVRSRVTWSRKLWTAIAWARGTWWP